MTIDEDFRRATEEVLLAQAETGEGVILGRGAAIVLRDRPNVLRARLDGPADHRAAQAARLTGIPLDVASRRSNDSTAPTANTRDDSPVRTSATPELYDIVLDSTRIDLARCVELLEVAARARAD